MIKIKRLLIKLLIYLINKLGYKHLQTICYGETSRVYKGKIAPDGKIWYILKTFSGSDKFVSALCFRSVGMDDDKREAIYTKLLMDTKKRFGI